MSDPATAPSPSHPLSAADHRARGAGRLVRAIAAVSVPAAAKVAEAMFCKSLRPAARPDETAFLARAVRFTVPAVGVTITGYRWGDAGAPRVMLVHGWWSHAGRFVAMADDLLRRGFEVVSFDAPGHGRSGGWRASMPEFAWTLRVVAEAVGPLHATVGHSLGGAASIFAISRGLGVSRAVTLAAPADVPHWADRFRDALDLAPEVDHQMRRNLETRLGLQFEELKIAEVAGTLSVPGLVIHDHDDTDVPVDEGRQIAEAWSAATFHGTAGLGHRRVLRDGDVIRRVGEFLDERRETRGDGR
jgi:pimeloyl-ACP methyl ester carboxylesterase